MAIVQKTAPPPITFTAPLCAIGDSTILRLPQSASKKLPSRGQVAVRGTINGHDFETVVEPDGSSGHWIRIDNKLEHTARLRSGDTATVEIAPAEEWPEPVVPHDLQTALAAAPADIQSLWKQITPMARWEWVRWVGATANADTRNRRVEVTISKMQSGKHRPCCFNRAGCTDPNLSKNGRLLEPKQSR